MNHRPILSEDGSNLTMLEKIGYSVMAFGSDFWSSYINTFLLIFYTDVAHIEPGIAGTIISLAVIWDAINDPVIASFADNHKFKTGERCRPYLIIASIPVAILLAMMFYVVGSGGTNTVIWAFVTYFLFRIPSTFHNLPTNNMRQLATPFNDQRVKINTFTSFGGALGIATTSLAMHPLVRAIAGVDANKNLIDPQKGYFWGAVVVGILCIACSLFNYFTTKERVHPMEEEKIPFFYSCKTIIKNKQFLQNLLIHFFYGTITSLVTGYAMYYCYYVICEPSLVTPVSAMYILGVVIALPFVQKIYNKFGRNKMLMLGAGILLLGGIVFLLFPKSLFAPFFFCLCVGVGSEVTIVMVNLNRASITDIIEFNDGGRMDAMVSNVSTLIKKGASAILTMVLGWVLQAAQYDGDAGVGGQPQSAVLAIILIMGLGTVISAIVFGILAKSLSIDEELAKIDALKAQGYTTLAEARKSGAAE